jgi:probable phosphoglycerate mutase
MNPSLPEMVWLLRHAETTAPHVFNGHESDVLLSELGEAQSEAIAEWFVPLRPTAVVSSAMRRAMQTARPIAERCGVPATFEVDLHERKIGAMAGQAFSLTDGPWPATVKEWSSGNAAFTTPQAESFADLNARIIPAWNCVMAAHPGGRVVIVAHGIVVKILLLHLLEGGDPRAWGKIGRIQNVAVTGLKPLPSGWQAEPLLYLPESVARLTELFPSSPSVRSEG